MIWNKILTIKATRSALLLSFPVLLVGCGSGSTDGGGGGGGPTPKTYTWQFVQMKERTQSAMQQSCGNSNTTIFNLDDSDTDSSNWLYTFAIQAPNISNVLVLNADGTPVEDSLDENDINQTNGTLTFSENDIPDGGYLTIVDSFNGIDNIISVEKDAIQDSIVKINREQGQQSCLINGSLASDPNLKKINIGTFTNVTTTSIEGYISGKSAQDSSTVKADIEVLADNENLLLSGYNASNELIGYRFINNSELSDNSSSTPNTAFLDPIDDSKTIDFTNTIGATFNSLTMKALYSGFTFDWFNWSSSANSFTSSAPEISSIDYSSNYQGTLNGWNITHNQTLPDITNEVDLTALDMPSQPVFLDCSGEYCYLMESDVTTLNSEINKVSFSTGTARYTLYSTTDTLVPKIDNISYPDNSTTLNIEMLLADSSDTQLKRAFLVNGNTTDYQPTDEYIDLITIPSEDITQRQTMATNNYTLIMK